MQWQSGDSNGIDKEAMAGNGWLDAMDVAVCEKWQMTSSVSSK